MGRHRQHQDRYSVHPSAGGLPSRNGAPVTRRETGSARLLETKVRAEVQRSGWARWRGGASEGWSLRGAEPPRGGASEIRQRDIGLARPRAA